MSIGSPRVSQVVNYGTAGIGISLSLSRSLSVAFSLLSRFPTLHSQTHTHAHAHTHTRAYTHTHAHALTKSAYRVISRDSKFTLLNRIIRERGFTDDHYSAEIIRNQVCRSTQQRCRCCKNPANDTIQVTGGNRCMGGGGGSTIINKSISALFVRSKLERLPNWVLFFFGHIEWSSLLETTKGRMGMDPLEVQGPLKAGSNQPRISLSLECFKCGGWIFGGNELSEIQIKCSDSEAVICNLPQTNSFYGERDKKLCVFSELLISTVVIGNWTTIGFCSYEKIGDCSSSNFKDAGNGTRRGDEHWKSSWLTVLLRYWPMASISISTSLAVCSLAKQKERLKAGLQSEVFVNLCLIQLNINPPGIGYHCCLQILRK